MLSINPIARVVVNTVRASASPAAFDTGLILVKDASFASSRRIQWYDSASAAVAGLTALDFSSESDPVKAAVKYFAASPAPSRLLVSCHPASESMPDALEEVLDRTGSFYGVLAVEGTVSAADWLAFAQYIEAQDQPLVLFLPVNAVGEGQTLNLLYSAHIKRAFPFYTTSVSDCAAVMGTAMGLELSHRDSAFALCYKTVQGIQPNTALTASMVEAIKAVNGNVYITRGYNHLLLESGTVSGGMRYDEVLYIDEIADALQNAAVNLIAENPDKLSQTDDATAQFINRFSSILMNYTDRGILASAAWRGSDIGPVKSGEIVENGFRLWADSYDNQSDADRAAHRAVPVQCALCLAGSIESIVITVNVQQ